MTDEQTMHISDEFW